MSFRYFFPWLGSSPSTCSNPKILVALAFGRDSFPDKSDDYYRLVNYKTEEEKINFCKEVYFDPGDVNKKLAEIIESFEADFIYIQWEIYFGFSDEWLKRNKQKLILVWPGKGYFNSLEVIKQMIDKGAGKQTPLIIAHCEHIERAKRIWEKETGRMPLIPRKEQQPLIFDEDSIQWWTRSFLFFTFREMMTRFHHFIKGMI